MNLKCVSAIGDLYWKSRKKLIAQLGDVNREARSQLANRTGGTRIQGRTRGSGSGAPPPPPPLGLKEHNILRVSSAKLRDLHICIMCCGMHGMFSYYSDNPRPTGRSGGSWLSKYLRPGASAEPVSSQTSQASFVFGEKIAFSQINDR